MFTLRRSNERGHANHGWLDSYHTFSFADYSDPQHMGFRALRVINEDRVAGGQGFGTHPHRDMEIVTYIIAGALAHRDSMGTSSVLRAGDVQRMTAGTGVFHSEINASADVPVHLLQIWILPEKERLAPGYEEKHFSADEKRGRLRLIAARDAQGGSLAIHQDVSLYASLLAPGEKIEHPLAAGRHAWLHVVRGDLRIAGHSLQSGDAIAVSDEPRLAIEAASDSEFLLFDLA